MSEGKVGCGFLNLMKNYTNVDDDERSGVPYIQMDDVLYMTAEV